jgi:hypothetical protein
MHLYFIFFPNSLIRKKQSDLNIMCAPIIKIRNYDIHIVYVTFFCFLYNIIYLLAIVSCFLYTYMLVQPFHKA